MNQLDTDASVVYFLRVFKKLGLISKETYLAVCTYLVDHGHNKKNAWRKANWKEFLKSG